MCGIVLAKDTGTFLGLCKLNESRGNYSFGGLYLNGYGYMLQRQAGTLATIPPLGFHTYLGHNRAPTSEVDHFDPNNSHPFVHGDWIVAHNGIIRNFEEVQKRFGTKFSVDSNLIPWLLNLTRHWGNKAEENTIREAFEMLAGTFGCWIHNVRTGNTYIYRATNSLFYSKELNAISSVEFKDSGMMKDNTLFSYTDKGIEELWTSESTESPFYIPE